jgi:hypothetical protein
LLQWGRIAGSDAQVVEHVFLKRQQIRLVIRKNDGSHYWPRLQVGFVAAWAAFGWQVRGSERVGCRSPIDLGGSSPAMFGSI